jgi:hypothetical protein
MPAEARLERDIDGGTDRGDVYKLLIALFLMTAPALVYIYIALA